MRNNKRRYSDNNYNPKRKKRYRRGGGGYGSGRGYRSSRNDYHNDRGRNNRRPPPKIHTNTEQQDSQRPNVLRPPHDVLLLNFYYAEAQLRNTNTLVSIFRPFGRIIQFVEVQPLTSEFLKSIVVDFEQPANIQNMIDTVQDGFRDQVKMERRGPETRFETLQITTPDAHQTAMMNQVSRPVSMNLPKPPIKPPTVQTTPIMPKIAPPTVQTTPIMPKIAPPPPPPPAPTDPRRPMANRPAVSRNPVRVEYRVISPPETKTTSSTPISANPAPNKSYSYNPDKQSYYSYPDVRNADMTTTMNPSISANGADLSEKPMDLGESTPSATESVSNAEPEKEKPKRKKSPESNSESSSTPKGKLKAEIVKYGRKYTDAAFKEGKITKAEAKEIIKKLHKKVASHITSRTKWQKRMKVLLNKEYNSIVKLAKGYIGSYRKRKKIKKKKV